MGHGRHGGHVDHVKDLIEVLHHAQVVKNPDLVYLWISVDGMDNRSSISRN